MTTMPTNQITQFHSASEVNMTDGGFPDLIDRSKWASKTGWGNIQLLASDLLSIGAINEPQSGTTPISLKIATSLEKRSPRNGRLPRTVAVAQREAADPDYKARLSVARAILASDLMEGEVTSLAKLRLKQGLSQQQLAKNIGTSQPHIAKIEAGTVKIFWDTATRIADALNVTLDELRPLIRVSSAHPKIVVEES
jgi:DNA-binding XRE family transcriptional regulator